MYLFGDWVTGPQTVKKPTVANLDQQRRRALLRWGVFWIVYRYRRACPTVGAAFPGQGGPALSGLESAGPCNAPLRFCFRICVQAPASSLCPDLPQWPAEPMWWESSFCLELLLAMMSPRLQRRKLDRGPLCSSCHASLLASWRASWFWVPSFHQI